MVLRVDGVTVSAWRDVKGIAVRGVGVPPRPESSMMYGVYVLVRDVEKLMDGLATDEIMLDEKVLELERTLSPEMLILELEPALLAVEPVNVRREDGVIVVLQYVSSNGVFVLEGRLVLPLGPDEERVGTLESVEPEIEVELGGGTPVAELEVDWTAVELLEPEPDVLPVGDCDNVELE